MMSCVPVNTLHSIPLPWEVCVKGICVSGHLGYIDKTHKRDLFDRKKQEHDNEVIGSDV